jgi:amino acid adenylation domain-containing protein
MQISERTIPRRANRHSAPLSFAQQRLWFLDQLEPNTALYNVPKALRLKGALKVSAMHDALNAILERHEVLHSVIFVRDGNPVQIVTEGRSLSLPLVDLSAWPRESRDQEMYRLLDIEARRPFDLSSDLMIRATLVRLDTEDHLLLLVIHHVACDGWSFDVLFQELAALYAAFSRDRPSPLFELPIQYADFAVWQRQWLQGEKFERQLSYWKKRLSGVSPLNFPTDRPRPAVRSSRGARKIVRLGKKLSDELKALSRQHRVSLFMTLLAAFQTLIYRYTGRDDIAVGSPIANRTFTEIEGLLGFFANTLVLRADLSTNPSFLELVQRVREIALDAYEHQDLPIERLVEEINPERSLSYSPLFQVIFALQNASSRDFALGDLKATIYDFETGTAKFDLSLSLADQSGSLSGFFEYNTDLFEASTIDRMLGHLQTLFEGIVANPEQRLSKLPLLTDFETEQILVDWNKTKKDIANNDSIHRQFETQVERTPDAVAVVFEDKQLTYEQLNRGANQLAHYLRALGVGLEVPVAICVERSMEMVLGILGILKAGGFYVPLDPAYPRDRLAFMLRDAKAPVLLTQEHLTAKLPENGLRIICLDRDWKAISQENENNPATATTADNLAYVMYTSGSTGTPKGVSVTHRGVVRLVKEADYVKLDEKEIFLQFAPLCFDASTFEIWACLLKGAKLVIFPPHTPSLEELGHFIEESRVTILWLTSALFQPMADSHLESLGSVRQLLAGGDVLSAAHAKRVFDRLPSCRLINGYGPTESTTFTCCYPVISAEKIAASVPIGRPIANTEVYVLDGHFNPVPIGVSGHLYIGGDGLARGYLNNGALTAEKFIPNPFSDQPGARLYHTGDLARYLTDGNIEFLGRKDYQVKIRGFRIELGEIEALLGQHPAVEQAVLLAREDLPGDKRLVAYLLLRQREALAPSILRDFLKERLPDYMQPSAFVFLDRLPLTSNGKVDRKVLPAPEDTSPSNRESFLAPRNALEKSLAKIWAEVLKLERIGIEDNFFDRGGHSLLATQLISRVRDSLDISLSVRAVFENPTLAELAAKIADIQDKRAANLSETSPTKRQHYAGPASFGQQRLWFLQQLEPNNSAYNMLSAFRLKGCLNLSALERSLLEISRRHRVLQASFELADGELHQVISGDAIPQLPVLDFTHLPQAQRDAAASEIINQEVSKPFDLAKGPLVRASALRMGEDDHIFLYLTHHIVSDGWSLGIFYRELSTLYEAFCDGVPAAIEDLKFQYTDYAAWQKKWFSGDELENQLLYWKRQLAGMSPLQSPTDRARPAIQTYRGARESLTLPEALVRSLREMGRQERVSLFMILLAAFNALLHRYTGQDDIVVGSPIAGRNRSQIEGLIGFFVNTLVLRTDLSGNPTFRELLGRVRAMALDAYEHQDTPFEKLVEVLKPERDLSRTPLFQVFFNMFSVKTSPLRLQGLTVEPIKSFEPESKFDLTLYVREEDQEIKLALVYNADLFYRETASRMLRHFQTLLEGVTANPEQLLSALPLLHDAEKRQLLVEWNNTKADYPNDKCVHEFFEEQVARTPHAVAVSFEGDWLTYHELNQRANRLARHLRNLGVGPEVVVGLCMERCLEMVVGMLGILKAGGAYVPLDPEYPQARLAYMVDQAEVRLLVTKERWLRAVPNFKGDAICLDRAKALLEHESGENPQTKTRPDNLAYVIYTSGSTGKPKGVLTCHRGVVSYLSYLRQTYGLNSVDTVLQLPSLSFDASVRDLIGPLSAGAQVLIVNEVDVKDPAVLLSKINDHGVTCILSIVPTTLTGLLEAIQNKNLIRKSLRLVLVSGEPLSASVCRKARETFGQGTWIVNQYGPTETTMTCSYGRVLPSDADQPVASLGRPIPNVRMYILDNHLYPVPIGIPGEICVGGVGLARGYANSPDLTAERFIPDPFSAEPNARLYRTGDLARYRSDGRIEFLGRVDHQVKIRGFRVEIGEIEAVLSHHPGVQQAIVVACDDAQGRNRLVAYVIPKKGEVLVAGELRDFLRRELPDYMIPSMFMMLDTFPLTPNRKVDRRALPVPEQRRPELTNPVVQPCTVVQEVLARIWGDVLKLDQVGIYDNFFELGGHSLLATQVISRASEALQVDLPLRAFFENPTVADLAIRISQVQAQKSALHEVGAVLTDVESLSEEEAQQLLAKARKRPDES